jgi:hypothetical protein
LPSCRSNFAKVDDITQKVEQACSRAMWVFFCYPLSHPPRKESSCPCV